MNILCTPTETMMSGLKRRRLTSLPEAVVLLTCIHNVSTLILSWHYDNLDSSFLACLKHLVG